MRAVLLAALLLLLVPATAAAAPPDTDALKRAGVKVTWPVVGASDVLDAGYTMSVRVKRTRPGKRVRLSLIQLRPRKVLARQSVSDGRFRATLPDAPQARYRLVMELGKKRWWSIIRTPAAAAPLPPLPTPTDPKSGSGCATDTGARAATLTLSRTTARAGDAVSYTLRNTGEACLEFGSVYTWQRQTATGWEDVPCNNCAFPLWLGTLPPGQHYNAQAPLPAGLAAGRYRLVKPVGDLHPSAELDVTS
jgi:hypothetical protein